jgi:integrase
MSKRINQLTDKFVREIEEIGRFHDGQSLFLQVEATTWRPPTDAEKQAIQRRRIKNGQEPTKRDRKTGEEIPIKIGTKGITRNWIFQFTSIHKRASGKKNKQPRMGLGGYPKVSLQDARKRRKAAQDLVDRGINPIEHKKAAKRKVREEQLKTVTFSECAETYLQTKAMGGPKSKRLADVMRQELKHAMPKLGSLAMSQIDGKLVVQVLTPLWLRSSGEIGPRVRLALERLFDYATYNGYRSGDNPAALKDIQIAIPGREKKREVKHHEALAYHEVPGLIAKLRQPQKIEAASDVSPWLLEFIIQTAVRKGQAEKMRWREVNFRERMWHSPKEHTKAGTEHNIPLTDRTIALLQEMRRLVPPRTDDDLVFPGTGNRDTMLGRNTILRYLQKLGYDGPSIHGFRSAFKLWAAKTVDEHGARLFHRDLSELALHHVIASAVELSYLRLPDGVHQEDFREERRPLMAAWSEFLDTPAAMAEVHSIAAA